MTEVELKLEVLRICNGSIELAKTAYQWIERKPSIRVGATFNEPQKLDGGVNLFFIEQRRLKDLGFNPTFEEPKNYPVRTPNGGVRYKNYYTSSGETFSYNDFYIQYIKDGVMRMDGKGNIGDAVQLANKMRGISAPFEVMGKFPIKVAGGVDYGKMTIPDGFGITQNGFTITYVEDYKLSISGEGSVEDFIELANALK